MYETRENNARILSKFVPYKLYKQNTEKSRSEKKREKREAKFAPLVYRRTENESGSARTCKWLGIRWVVPGGRCWVLAGFVAGSQGSPGHCWMDVGCCRKAKELCLARDKAINSVRNLI